MKKFISLLLSLAMLFSITSGLNISASAQEIEGYCDDYGDVKYKFDVTSGLLTIYGDAYLKDYNNYYRHTVAPWYDYRTSIKSVIIEQGVRGIGSNAFDGCTNLTSVSIPEGVEYIGDDAFNECTSLTSVVIPNGTTVIYYEAFNNCKNLLNITLPDTLESIDNTAFDGTAYYNSKSNWENGVLYINNALIKAEEDFSGTHNIKYGTTIIAEYAFYGSGLDKVTIPNTVKYINPMAFASSPITEITIPSSVEYLCYRAFEGSNLKTINFAKNSDIKMIGSHVFDGTPAYYNAYDSSTDGSVYFGPYLFDYRGPLADEDTLYIKDGTIGIASMAIDENIYVVTPETVEKNISNIIIPESLKYVGYGAFYYCPKVEEILFPESVERLWEGPFNECESLKKITIKNPLCVIDECSIDGNYASFLEYNSNMTICGYTGSTVDSWCNSHYAYYDKFESIGTYKCNHSFVPQTKDNGSKRVWKPSCTEPGYNWYICEFCRCVKSESFGQPLGHDFSNNSKTCSRCNAENPNFVAPTEPLTQPTTQTTAQGVTQSIPQAQETTVSANVASPSVTESVKSVSKSKATSIKKLAKGKKSFKATWKKVSGIAGYQIQYSTDKKFKKSTKTITIKKSKTTSTTIKNLKSKKKYYVRVRTYKNVKVNGKTTKIYSSWSKSKSIKTK